MRNCMLFGILLVGFAACHQLGQQKEKRTITRNNVEISYVQCGKADTTLLFIHGWCINKKYWENQVKYFCNRYNVVAIDLPGFGESGKNRNVFTIEDYPEDVKTVIDSLGLKHVVLIGHSMSGDIIIQVANKYPEHIVGIIGIDNLSDIGTDELTQEQKKQIDTIINAIDTSHIAASYLNSGLFLPTTDTVIVRRVINDILHADSVAKINSIKSLMLFSPKEKGILQQLNYKLFLVSSDAHSTDTSALRKYCKSGYQVFLVHKTGHYPMLEKPEEFNRQLEKALHQIGLN